MDFERQAKLELEHIKLELDAGRAKHMRHFIDQYFCFKNGYVRGKGTAHWDAILWNEWVSESAEELHDGAGYDAVTRDHIVPLQHIVSELSVLRPLSLDSIAELLDRRVAFATITKEENTLLRDAKLNSKMPEGFVEPGHHFFDNPRARYAATGIILNYRGRPSQREKT